MIGTIAEILNQLLKLLCIWVEGAEKREAKNDVDEFTNAVTAGDSFTVNRLLHKLRSQSGVSGAISLQD